MVIIQVITKSGKTIDGARWIVDPIQNIQIGQNFSISFETKDAGLIEYATKFKMIDKENKKNHIIYTFKVKNIKHMLTTNNNTVDTMYTLFPNNRTDEQLLQYILNPTKTNEKFLHLIRGH
jgi:hypothetical protein